VQAVKTALRAAAVADSALLALLGGASVFYRRPPNQAIFPRVTFFKLPVSRDKEIPREDGLYQFDTWSKSADLNDAIGDRIKAIFDKRPLVLAGVTLAEVVRIEESREMYEDDTEIHHLAQTFRVITFG
jgi:hypothetical protein